MLLPDMLPLSKIFLMDSEFICSSLGNMRKGASFLRTYFLIFLHLVWSLEWNPCICCSYLVSWEMWLKTENKTSTLCTKGCVETNMPLFKPNKHQPKRPPFHKEAQYSLLSNLCNLDGLITVLHTKLFYLSILC